MAKQQWITWQGLIDSLKQADIVLLGEVHDEDWQHKVEQQLIQDLPIRSLALEMLLSEQQAQIEKTWLTVRSSMPCDSRLKVALAWSDTWSWSAYSPVICASLGKINMLYGTNLSPSEIQIIWQGAWPLNGRISTQTSVKEKLANIMRTWQVDHASVNTDRSILIDRFVQIQQFRDRRMAEVLVNATKPSVLLAGRYHVSKEVGVPLHLKDYGVVNMRVLMLVTHRSEVDESEADFIYIRGSE